MIFSCKDIEKAYGTDTVLDKISFKLEEKEHLAIVGVNGAGKTTLLRIITGEESADGGEIYMRKDISAGYLKQNINIDSKITIYQELMSVFDEVSAIEKELSKMEAEMREVSGEKLKSLMAAYGELSHKFEESGGYSVKSRIRGILKGLGFDESMYEMPVSLLSGGQQTRLNLAKLLLASPDLLILDEPTNHLDIESVEWLEDFLKGYRGSIMVVSHDRFFLDKIAHNVLEIENHKGRVYSGNYTKYMEKKRLIYESDLKAYANQQAQIKHQEKVIETLRSFNREKSIKRAESREKALNKMEKLEKPFAGPEKIRLAFKTDVESGSDVLSVLELKKSFDGVPLFENISFEVKKGEKVALIGRNGIGKTTLFNILRGRILPSGGRFKLGVNVNMRTFSQTEAENLSDTTPFEEILSANPRFSDLQARNALAAFQFKGDDVFKKISALSGGEKGRLALAKLMVSGANFLLLDEPTNHLDIFSKEVLEEAILSYEGTVLFVSHDRYFINRTADKIIELTPEKADVYNGNYDYYLEKRKFFKREIQAEEVKAPSQTKEDWLKQKEDTARRRKYENQLKKAEKRIEDTEARIAEIDEKMYSKEASADPDLLRELYEEKEGLEARLMEYMAEWEELMNSEETP